MEFETRLERILNKPLAKNAIRQWPQSGEQVVSRETINTVESKFEAFRLAIGRRIECDNLLIVEWTSDYGDGKLHRNVTIAEIENGVAVKVTDYWGAPFDKPTWREDLTTALSPNIIWPTGEKLQGDL